MPYLTSTTIIRTASSADLCSMCELLYELFSIEQDFTPQPEKQLAGLNLLLKDPFALVLVAETDGMISGMCTVQSLVSTAEGGKVGLIEDVIIKQGMRGQGIGRKLLETALETTRRMGMTRLQLLCDIDNAPAMGFYFACGWSKSNMICFRRH